MEYRDDTWLKMHRTARSLDLDKGGLYDARHGGAIINLWVSPQDHPPSWAGVGEHLRPPSMG